MGRSLPNRPGWYRGPDEPRSLRYWDGRSWTTRARPEPPWALHAGPFDPSYEDQDRSVEGPVHPHELREPVASGAWSREWLSWRPRQAAAGWHRARVAQPEQLEQPLRAAPAKLSPSRRPLLALMCLLIVAVGVVVSSVAFISPYETKGGALGRDEVAAARFSAEVNKLCQVQLSAYRGALAWGDDGPTIEAGAQRVDDLGKKIAALNAPLSLRGPLNQWLLTLSQFAAQQTRYAEIVGSAEHLSSGRRIARPLAPSAQVAAAEVRQVASGLAVRADTFSATLQLQACALEPVPAS
ncbi:MAG TPA: DUF2510 domain-containing protein [Acidimicrobiales bacterium]|nr:DUF2510 domain-containing protein [Acidimicrobiales bacterium]